MQQSFSPDRIVTKAESIFLKRNPLAVISYANNEKASTSKAGESTILCKRIDNSAHFVDLSQQLQPAKKFTPLAIPLESMKRKNLQQTSALHARVSVTEPAEYIQNTTALETQPLHTEASESSRNKYKNIPKERGSASVKPRSKGKPKDAIEKKESEAKLSASKHRAQIKDMLKGPQKIDKKPAEEVKAIKRTSPRKTATASTTAQRENIPPHLTATMKAQKTTKKPAENKAPSQEKLKKPLAAERKSAKSHVGVRGSELKSQEKAVERSPMKDTTELDKFVKYNAMRIMEKMKEQKMQDEFERRLNEERKIALTEGNRRIREANFMRFNYAVKPRNYAKTRPAWGADQRKLERPPRSSSSQKRPRPKIEDEERRRVLGLDHLDEEQILRLRKKALMTMQETLDKSEEHGKAKRILNEEEHEDIQRYMIEKKMKMEEEERNKRREEYEDYEKKKRNLERLFVEIRESRELVPQPKPKKKGKKRTKRRKTHKEESSGLRGHNALTEPNDHRQRLHESDDDENYSLLYDQYKEIIKSKTTPKEERKEERESSNERRGTGGRKKKTVSPQRAEQQRVEQKKKEYREKYDELSDRYERNLGHTQVHKAANKGSKKSEARGSHKGRRVLENERTEAQKIIMEMDTDNFTDNDYVRSDSLRLNSEDAYRRGAEEESEVQSQDLPDNSAREIVEAAAVFIQKNYRGYRTRKILTEYINQLNQLYQEELELEEGEYEGSGREYYEGEEDKEEEEEGEEEEDPRQHLQNQGLFDAHNVLDNSAREIIEAAAIFIQKNYRGYRTRKELVEYIDQLNQMYQDEMESGHDYEAGQGEIHGEELVADDEKQSLRSLLEKQKLDLHEEYEGHQEEDEEKSEEVDDRHFVQGKYKGLAEPQYNMFYGHGDLQYDENGEVIRTEDYSHLEQDQVEGDDYEEEEEVVHKEDAAYFAVAPPRRARSDGEIIDLYQFDLDQEEEEESDEDNQISLHNDGEDDYQMLMAANKKFGLEKAGIQDKYLENLIRGKDSRSNRLEQGEDSQGNEYEENPEDQEEYGEEYQERYDPRFQKGYLQGYGEDYGDQDEDEEGYIHESNYDVEYGAEDEAALYQKNKQGKTKSMQYEKRYSEGDIVSGEHEGEEEYEEEDLRTPDEEEMEHDDQGEQGYLSQQQGNRQDEGVADNEKMVMISTINSEEEVDGMHYPEGAGSQQFGAHPQRRIKSDIINRRPETESYSQSQRDTEERKSQTTSQRDSQVARLSQKDQVSSRYQVEGESQDALEGEGYDSQGHAGEGEEHVSVDMLDPNDKLENTDSEHFREELIQELSHYHENDNKSEHQVHEEDRGTEHEGELEEEKTEEVPPQRSSSKTAEKAQSTQAILEQERLLAQKTREANEQYQAELNRLKEEQAQKWEQMMTHLSLLTSQDELHLNKDLKAFIETLQKQSEINKRQLTEDGDTQSLLEAQHLISKDRPEANFFNEPSYGFSPTTGALSVQHTKHMIASNMPPASHKRLEMVSPLQESKYGKKKKPFGFAKKTNLQIDINVANEENNSTEGAPVEQGPLNLDLSQMRLVLGSEQLLREQSARTLSQSVSAPSDVESVDLQGQESAEAMSIFERDPFKEFTRRKFKELMQQENMKNLIKMREQALEIRHKTHLDHMKKMLETRRFSPRTFQNKKIELEKWINKEREIIQKTKKDIERGWLSTADSIQRTQRDLMFLQKLGTHTDGRNTNTSGDISLRHSFTDEENFENAESQSERLSKRSFFGTGADLRTPSSSKNIKIIDKFELKDNIFSPQLTASGLVKKEPVEEVKGDEVKEFDERHKNLVEVPGSGSKVKEAEEATSTTERKKAELQGERLAHENQAKEKSKEDEEDKLQELTEEAQPYSKLSRMSQDKKDQLRKESPRNEEDEEVELQAEEPDEEIEWENEALQSPLHPDNKTESREYTPGKSAFSARKDLVSPLGENMPSISSSYSPKSQEDLRFMIQEKLGSLKPQYYEENTPGAEDAIKELEDEDHVMEPHVPDNIQTKTDIICGEILDEIFNEFGEELAADGKEHMWNKVALIGEEPPVQNLQNMIENNYFFHAGAEHVNFQANIPMPLSPSAEYIRLQHEKNAEELQLTPEQQMEKQYQDAQQELLKTLGIKTEVAAVTKYLDLLIDEITGPYKENFLRNINTPLGFSTSEKLNNMRNYDLGASDSSSLAMSSSDSQLILEIHLYFKIEEKIMEEDPNKNEVSTELEHIHNKMIFDCVNEILDAHRPFGINGQPFPWKVGSKLLKSQAITEQNMEGILEKMKMKIIDWASYLCGYYGEGDEFVIDKTQSFIDEYLAQVREERILRMLSEEIFELENKWITYDDEEAEVELEIADLVFDKMVTEAAELIAQIYEKKQVGGPDNKGNAPAAFNPNARKMNQRAGFSDITKIDTDLNFNSV